ncbi:NAD(P)-dependent oxidoreductase [Lachnospiraceae bacterium 62-35]
MKDYTVFIADDYKLPEILDDTAEQLRKLGIKVIRGPKTAKGKRLEYSEEILQELFGEADAAMFSSRSICDSRVIHAAPKLRGIVNPTIAVDTVDVELATENGILVGNGAIAENYIEMSEATIMLMLMLMYDPFKSIRLLKENLPEPSLHDHWARMMYKKTVGLLGLGRIGRGVAERLSTWDMDIIAYDPYIDQELVPDYVEMVDLDSLYKRSDLIGVFLVVTDETRGMLNDEAFSRMKEGVKFINTSRGQVVDEAALARALESGKVSGAALDTFQVEPLPEDSLLRKMDNVILTPHIVGHALECQLKLAGAAVENIMNILEGKPPKYLVNPKALPKFQERFCK